MARNRVINKGTDERVALFLRSYDQAEEKRLPFEPTWIEIARYIQPRINNFEADNLQGKKRTNYILDPSPEESLTTSSDGYQAYMFPRSASWFELGLEEEELEQIKANALWLERVTKMFYAELARSTFYEQGGLVVDNGLGIGTSTCYVEENEEKRCSEYLSLHPKEVYIARNRYGLVDTLFRRYQLDNRVILEEFADELGEALDAKTIEGMKGKPFSKEVVIHGTFPRAERWADGKFGSAGKPWASITVLEDSQVMLRESGFDEFPFAVWCCELNTDEDYGRSPAWKQLPNAKRLQVVVKSQSQAVQVGALSPQFYPEELADVLDLSPHGGVPYRDFSRKVLPIQTSTINLQHVEAIAQKIRNMLDDGFDVPFFLAFSRRPDTQITATEVFEIAGERAALMGTKIGRMETDFLDPTITLGLRNAARAGRLPPPPPQLRQKNATLKIKYIGPLAALQKRYHGQRNMYTTFQQAVPFFKLFPTSTAVVNATASVRKLLREGGYPAEGLNSEQETQAQLAAMAEQQQLSQAAELAQAAGKLPPEMLGQATGTAAAGAAR